jgi:hypothetical protein
MNMKKSIAGVMAGAMAVSAMAASVSAVADQETITLAYDLKEYKYASKPASVTIMQYYATADKPAYFIDTATETAIDGATTYGTINFGVTANWGMLKSKSIDLSLAATGLIQQQHLQALHGPGRLMTRTQLFTTLMA